MTDFALNHMAVPRFGAIAFLDLASSLGCVGVEFRNDLPGALFGGLPPEAIRDAVGERDLRILALAEVKMFDDWSPTKAAEALALMDTAARAGAGAISLIPRNDGQGMDEAHRRRMLSSAIAELAPALEDHGLFGLIEPLGFGTCALSSKAEVAEAIAESASPGRFRIVHDTFHHHIAGGGPLFPGVTGIVHVSGVTDPALAPAAMRDGHRVLVDAADRLGNVEQIAALQAGGYAGPVSFEPFAREVHDLTDPRAALGASMAFIRDGLARRAA